MVQLSSFTESAARKTYAIQAILYTDRLLRYVCGCVFVPMMVHLYVVVVVINHLVF
jgi:hypothetical protein